MKPEREPRTLALAWRRENSALLWSVAVIGLGLATALSAFVRLPLPFTPVPLTLQTMLVLLSGACLGAGAGAASQLVGLALLWGSPQLLAAAAPGGLFGPTGGYLLAFAPAAWLVGRLGGRGWRLVAAMLVADALILGVGTLQLSLVGGLPLGAALWAGTLPFVPGDLLKLALAAGLVRGLRAC